MKFIAKGNNILIFDISANAKINLGLEIIKKRSDNYHEVDMIMQSIDLRDNLRIILNNTGNICVKYNNNFNINMEDDIVYRCANLFFEISKIKNTGMLIEITKNIPIGAGLAGGSADGAGILIGLNKIYNNLFSQQELMNIGAQIGCDVPFCIMSGTARATGIGTALNKINNNLNYFIILVTPDIFISTREAYSVFDNNNNISQIQKINNLEHAIKNNNLKKLCENLYNKFECLISQKNLINKIKQEFINLGALGSCMSGSGPSVYGIFDSKNQAQICFENLKLKYKNIFLCEINNNI